MAEAVREMLQHNLGSLLIMGAGRLLGLFTSRDLMRSVILEQRDPETTLMQSVMRRSFPVLRRDMEAHEVMLIFEQHHLRHLPVVDQGLVVGVLSIGDIARWCATAHRTEIESLHRLLEMT